MVTREFRCRAHDYEFELQMEMDDDQMPKCPYGCSAKYVALEFRTPISIRSNGTSTQDALMKKLAADYGLSDMRNTDGQSVMSSTRVGSGGLKRDYQPFQIPKWEPSLSTTSVAPMGWAQRGDPAPTFKHPETMPGQKTGLEPIIRSRPPNALRAKTVFQKPK
jgi:hypothetical protein